MIITAAITGAATLPTLTPYLPWKPKDIADSAIGAAQAGASIVHIHARNPEDASPSSSPEIMEEILSRIRERSDVIICMTTGGPPTMSIQERATNVSRFRPEMCSFSLGSMNLSLRPSLKRIKKWRFEWEEHFLETSEDFVFRNSFKDLEYMSNFVRKKHIKPEFEVYDVGHLYNLAHLVDRGLILPPMHIQFVMGVLGGIGSMPEDLLFLKRKADVLFGRNSHTWSICGIGRAQFELAPLSIDMGGHIRVGLEDNIYLSKGVLAESNAQLVEMARRIGEGMRRQIASAKDARRILGLSHEGKPEANNARPRIEAADIKHSLPSWCDEEGSCGPHLC